VGVALVLPGSVGTAAAATAFAGVMAVVARDRWIELARMVGESALAVVAPAAGKGRA
jgi:hypothetical protein